MHLFEGDHLTDVYHRALATLKTRGRIVPSPAWNTRRLEIPVTMVINEPFDDPYISKVIPCGPDEITAYIDEICYGTNDHLVKEGKLPYTYSERIRKRVLLSENRYATGDEPNTTSLFLEVLRELERDASSTRAVIPLLHPKDILLSDKPCCNLIQWMVRDNLLETFVTFRSNDAIKASYMNMLALIELSYRVAKSLGVDLGPYTHVANSWHVYERDWKQLDLFCERYERGQSLTYTREEFFDNENI